MLSYEGVQDVLTALLVIAAVSFVVAVAWLSTRVREQPLIATAVVVFRSESGSGEETAGGQGEATPTGDTKEDEGAAGPADGDPGGGVGPPSQGPRDRPPAVAKVGDSPEMEVRRRRQSESTDGEARAETCPGWPDPSVSPREGAEPSAGAEATRGRTAESTEGCPSSAGDERPPGSIKIRLKFLDETQRYVFAQLTEQVGSFKRQHFSIEMDANRRIRLIFNGQLLSQDTSTLAQYGLFDNCVVHCHVSQPQHTNGGQSGDLAAQDEDMPYHSGFLAPLLYCVMVVMWYLRYEYGHLFNIMSTVILLFLTALLLISTYLLYITQNVPENGTSNTISARPQTEAQSTL